MWRAITVGLPEQVLMEQYYPAAFWLDMNDDLGRPPQITYLFSSRDEAYGPTVTRRLGFMHLIAGAKRSPVLQHMVAARLRAG